MKNQKEQQRNTAIESNACNKIQKSAKRKVKAEKMFKRGDILIRNLSIGDFLIFKEYDGEDELVSSWDMVYDRPVVEQNIRSWYVDSVHLATEWELERFFDDLKREGLRWNAETKEVEKIPTM